LLALAERKPDGQHEKDVELCYMKKDSKTDFLGAFVLSDTFLDFFPFHFDFF